MFEYHPYEGKFEGEKHLTQRNLERIADLKLGKAFKFAFISDTQRWYDETNLAVADINRREDVDFVLHGGDLTDFGMTEEFVWMRDCLLKIRKPWLTIIGNHDFLGHGEYIYTEMYGSYNYAFTVGSVRFEMLNTVALEFDYSTPVPDFNFLEQELQYVSTVNEQHPDSIQRCIFVMHSRPGDEQFNNNVGLAFGRYLQSYPNAVCFNGHNHCLETLEPFNNGILFHGISEINDHKYYLITINEDSSYELEVVDF